MDLLRDLFAGKETLRMLRKEPADHVQSRFIESLGKLGTESAADRARQRELVDGILAQAGPGAPQIFLLGGEPLQGRPELAYSRALPDNPERPCLKASGRYRCHWRR